MNLKHKETEKTLERNENTFNAIIEKVNEVIQDENIVFSHLIIDGVDVYEGHEEYINERLNELLEIEIITYKATQMIWETTQSINYYLESAIPSLSQLIDESYIDFSQNTWKAIEQLLEGIQWMAQFKEFASVAAKQPIGWNDFSNSFAKIEEQLLSLLNAIEHQDAMLILDILSHSILPAFEELALHVELMLQDETYLSEIN